ncbi:MAG: putative toxin-antitoxin system toxin component, PIN family, partial [Bacteroidales bacterium]|nr:putative toxin-antitoxin system toxin component, PIN family [Bacteroidales bacterium]
MKKVFLDTNVILDLILGREGADYAKQIIQFGIESQIRNHTSVLSLANIAYIIRKYLSHKETSEILATLFDSVTILPMGDQQVYQAMKIDGPDFEDSLQIACASAAVCDLVITNDKKHFKDIPLPVYTSEEFI